MKLTSVILLGTAMLAGCGGTANVSNSMSNSANSVVNSMNSNAAHMPNTNNNTGYVMNSNSTVPPSMPSNVTNVSPPSANRITGNSKMNTNSNKPNGKG
jgi:hypothetical protein